MFTSLPRPQRRAGVIATAVATVTALVATPVALAQTADSVVISEVYGGGGNSGAVYTYDFVELYNPTDAPVDLSGWQILQQSSAGNTGTTHTLSGSIEPGGFYLVQGASGNNSPGDLPAPDETGKFNFSGTNAIAELNDASGNTVDLVGWGNATRYETAPAPRTSNSTSVQRLDPAVDTDNNSVDFHVDTPTPVSSTAGEAPAPIDPADPGIPTPPADGTAVEIAEIQGTGATTPLDGQAVTTEGVVTAVYDEGGKNGFIIQTPGTGGEQQAVGDASHALFVYLGANAAYPEIGDSVVVTGTAGEHYGTTQISRVTSVVQAPEDFEPVTPIEIDYLPVGDDAREVYEHMLVQPTGAHTVTNNYQLNSYGEIGLSPDPEEALRQPTDVVLPGQDAIELQAENDARLVTLDDGRTRNYGRGDESTPLPYIAQDGGQTITTIRTGEPVDFQNPVVVDFDHDLWRFQPTTPVTGDTAGTDLPIAWEDGRADALAAVDTVAGDISLGTFNVLNYFTSLGEDEPGCGAYNDMHGNPVGTNRCDVRGAYSTDAFNDQQTKIVDAINTMDADIIGLQEIENTYGLTGDASRRDEAVAGLVDALNADAGEDRWAYVESPSDPADFGTDEDVIRLAFIYQPDAVEPVGESRIFDDQAYTGTARQPLAQEFAPVDGGESFVAINNHFKSKGSVSHGDSDAGDGQGNNPNVRNAQSQALLDHLDNQQDWADAPVFIIGDLNSYSREDAIRTFEANGFTNINTEFAGHTPTYQFGGQLGSLDHVLANEAAVDLVVDALVWEINGDEPIAFEYSRRNYNAVDFHDDSPFRSSDHDPIKVGLSLQADTPEEPGDGAPGDGSAGSSLSSGSSSLGIFAALAGVFALLGGGWWAINTIFAEEFRDFLARFR